MGLPEPPPLNSEARTTLDLYARELRAHAAEVKPVSTWRAAYQARCLDAARHIQEAADMLRKGPQSGSFKWVWELVLAPLLAGLGLIELVHLLLR